MNKASSDIDRKGLNDRELTQLQETGRVQTLGGFTLASLVASLDVLGLRADEVEVTGNGSSYGIELFVLGNDDG